MAERFTLYAGEPVATVLVGYENNRSGRINQVCSAYTALIADATPALTSSQWCAIVDVLNGTVLDDSMLRFIWAEIMDSESDGLGQKWDVDMKSLAEEIRGFTTAQLIALREIIFRFWNAVADSCEAMDTQVLLAKCGARFRD